MNWAPLGKDEVYFVIDSACQRMSVAQRRLWETIRIEPEKWTLHPHGDEGGGFWAVALFDQTVIWFNDIEEGFNRSPYTTHGTIGTYWCNQDQLEWVLQDLLDIISSSRRENH